MRQSIKFTEIYPSNKLYAWSREHNIVFAESQPGRINFGRAQDLTVFLLTWPYTEYEYTVL
jgi:hypothetical protein